ncbi:MAG TPA: prolyl oligopeptidase family serine peptidase [Myxococcaceae bacterium]|nr:prolyl oligopeptidase family serine peptidase [Myxococcaceae bacterium]
MPDHLFALTLLLPLATLAASKATRPPPAEKHPVVDSYHGESITDPYQWLESSNDEKVKAWTASQNAYTRAALDKLPSRAAIRERITELLTWESPAYFMLEYRGGRVFALKSQPPRQQPMLVVFPSASELNAERILLDPMALDPSGHTAIDFYVPTVDGKRVAVSLSKNGTESGDVTILEVATGEPLPNERVPRVNGGTAGGSVAWNADGSGFFYTRYPRGQERPPADRDFFQQVYFHKLGTPTEQDSYQLGKDFPRIAETALEASDDGAYHFALVGNGDGGDFALYLHGPSGGWTQISRFEDRLVGASFGQDGALYVLSRKDAPRGKVLRIPLATPALDKASVVVPEGEHSIQLARATASRLYLLEQLGGPNQLRVVDLQGRPLGAVPALPVSTVGGVEKLDGDDLLFANVSFLQPIAWYRYAAAEGKVIKTPLAQTAPVDTRNVEVVRETCTSKDGTRVPLNILRPKGIQLNGKVPVLLTGYGGFDIAITPSFSKTNYAWLEQGGVVAIANLRGGSEFGEAWHQQGMLTRKQNVFDDFYACAKRLVDLGYTRQGRLAIQGGSNGGLLMGAALTQHPEMYRAVVARVGIYDMLRVEQTPNGQFNITEYGTVKDPEQYRALRAYSPYHAVKNGVKYPAVLFTSGANDPRVDPFHARKMVAHMQEASASGRPILLRASGGGHGMTTPLTERIEEEVDVYSFLFNELGVRYRPVAKPPAPKAR